MIDISAMSWTARTESRTDAGSVNTGSYWRDRGPGARPTALHRSGAICDYADRGRRRRLAAVATPAAANAEQTQRPGSREISIIHLVPSEADGDGDVRRRPSVLRDPQVPDP